MPKCAGCTSSSCHCLLLPGTGITVTGDGNLGTEYVISTSGGGSGGPPLEGTYYVASNDARPEIKAMADFVCDGVADQVQIQAAVDAAFLHGFGTVALSEGSFNLTSSINFNDASALTTVQLRGAGIGGSDYNGPQSSTTIIRPFSMTLPAIVVSGALATSITNLNFLENLDLVDKDPMISLSTNNAVIIEHCHFDTFLANSNARARCISGSGRLKLRNSTLTHVHGACVAVSGSPYQIEISGNYFYSTDSNAGAFGANEYVIILDGGPPAAEGDDWPFIISNNFSDGNILGTVRLVGVAQGVVSNNNFLYDNTAAILLDQCYEIQVLGNQLGGGDVESIKALNSTYLQINDNQIIETGTHGIVLSGSNDCQVNNNSIVAGTNVASAAIFIDADSNTNMVTGNLIRGTTLYGIRVNNANCNDNWITNNDLKNSGTTPFSDVGTATAITAGNRL